MPELFPWFLLLHVLGAIIAFGPTFAFPIIGAMGGREPMHANFATRVSHRVTDRLVEPVALSMAVTGVGLIWSAGIDPFAPAYRWLLVAIAIYVFGVLFSIFVQRPTVKRIIELTGGERRRTAAAARPERGNSSRTAPRPGRRGRRSSAQRHRPDDRARRIVFLMVVKPSLGG